MPRYDSVSTRILQGCCALSNTFAKVTSCARGGHKDTRGRVLITLALASGLTSCGDECREYSEFTCKQIEAAEYNVFFAPQKGDAVRIGHASGLSQCGSMARSDAEV